MKVFVKLSCTGTHSVHFKYKHPFRMFFITTDALYINVIIYI